MIRELIDSEMETVAGGHCGHGGGHCGHGGHDGKGGNGGNLTLVANSFNNDTFSAGGNITIEIV
jgi:hypothetical protein